MARAISTPSVAVDVPFPSPRGSAALRRPLSRRSPSLALPPGSTAAVAATATATDSSLPFPSRSPPPLVRLPDIPARSPLVPRYLFSSRGNPLPCAPHACHGFETGTRGSQSLADFDRTSTIEVLALPLLERLSVRARSSRLVSLRSRVLSAFSIFSWLCFLSIVPLLPFVSWFLSFLLYLRNESLVGFWDREISEYIATQFHNCCIAPSVADSSKKRHRRT